MPKIAVLGASGHTGRLVVEALRRRGAEPVPLTRKDADATDRDAVLRAIRGCDAVANLAGPFLRNGLAPVSAAIEAGLPYVDTTGEQAFMLRVRDALGEEARRAGVPLVQALAFEYAFGDLATAVAFPDGGDELHVLYRNLRTQPSAGTKKSIARVLGAPACGYEHGKLRRVAVARHRRTFETSAGPRLGVSFAGGEVLTVPQHARFDTVRTYIQTKPSNARLTRAAGVIARVAMRGPLVRVVESMIDARHEAPDNARAGGEVHVERASAGASARDGHWVVATPDPYLATAEAVAHGVLELARGRPGSGWLAPAEAFDAKTFLAAMEEAMDGFSVTPFTPGSPKA